MLIVSNHVSDSANDKRNLLPNLDAAKENGYKVTEVLGDTGYYSEANVKGCRERKIDACIAVEKQSQGITVERILGRSCEAQGSLSATTGQALAESTGEREKMAHKLKYGQSAIRYRLRKQSVEPVFGIIKHCMRLRQFLTRGKENVSNEWNLICCAYNLKRLLWLRRVQNRHKGTALVVE